MAVFHVLSLAPSTGTGSTWRRGRRKREEMVNGEERKREWKEEEREQTQLK